MGVITTCTCTPYLTGNVPHYGEHIAWAESSAVCYANSVLGARTNREGGPSALAAALTGFTPAYGLHLDRKPPAQPDGASRSPAGGHRRFWRFGQGRSANASKRLEKHACPIFTGIAGASLESLKSFCASIATYGGVAMFHMRGITPEADMAVPPPETMVVTQQDLDNTLAADERCLARGS